MFNNTTTTTAITDINLC